MVKISQRKQRKQRKNKVNNQAELTFTRQWFPGATIYSIYGVCMHVRY